MSATLLAGSSALVPASPASAAPDAASPARPGPPRARWAAFLALLALQLTLVWTHAPWADEYQAALIARVFTSLPAAREAMRYEAHPPLWHALLALVQILAPDPALSLKLAQTAVMTASLALLILASPLPLAFAVLVALGYYPLIEYGTLARNYGLGVLLCYAALVLRERGARGRLAWVPLALLPMAGLQFGLVAGLGALLMLRERRGWWPGLVTLGAVSVAAIGLQALASMEAIGASNAVALTPFERALGTVMLSASALLPISPSGELTDWNRGIFVALYPWPLLTGLALYVVVPAMPRGRDGAFATGAFALATFVLSSGFYVLSGRHFALVPMVAVLAVWAEAGRGLAPGRIAWGVAALGALSGLAGAERLAARPFSPMPALARELAATGRKGLPIVVDRPLVGVEVLGALGKAPLRVPGRCRQDLLRWNFLEAWGRASPDSALDLAREAAREPGRALMMLASETPAPDDAWASSGAALRLGVFEGISFRIVLYEVTPSPGPVVTYPDCP